VGSEAEAPPGFIERQRDYAWRDSARRSVGFASEQGRNHQRAHRSLANAKQ